MQTETINIHILNEAKNLMGERFPLMVKYFIEDVEKYMREMREGCKSKNAEMIVRPAHTIKSSAAQIGATKVTELAKQMENLCREIIDNSNNDYSKVEGVYDKLKDEVSKAIEELNKLS